MVFDKGSDSVDFALVNRVKPGDVVVTQDYGLASMCLARCARVLNQNGLEYTADNIDALMLRRYENKKLLRAGKHPKGSAKRTKAQDEAFASTLTSLLETLILTGKTARVLSRQQKSSLKAFASKELFLTAGIACFEVALQFTRYDPRTQFLKALPEGLPLKGGPIHLIQLFR